MAHSWGTKFVKYTLVGFNLMFLLSGIILVIIGASVKAIYSDYKIFLDDKYFSLPNLLIAIGVLIFFISFFGCYGAIKESWILLYGFIGLLILIFIMEFSAGIAGYVLRDKTADYLTDSLKVDLMRYGSNKTFLIEKTWDIMQEEFQCCGVDGPGDWQANFKNSSLPLSCCKNSYGAIGSMDCEYHGTPSMEASKVAAQVAERVEEEVAVIEKKLEPLAPNNATPGNARSVRSDNDTDAKNITTSETSTSSTVPTEASTQSSDSTTSSTTPSTTTTTNSSSSSESPITTPGPYIINHGTPYSIGCVQGFGNFIKSHAVTLGGVGFAIACVQLLGILFACHLARQIKFGYYST